MSDIVKVIVSGNQALLTRLREPLAQTLQHAGLRLIEKGQPKCGQNPQFQVMYLQAEEIPPVGEEQAQRYTLLEEGA